MKNETRDSINWSYMTLAIVLMVMTIVKYGLFGITLIALAFFSAGVMAIIYRKWISPGSTAFNNLRWVMIGSSAVLIVVFLIAIV